MRYSWYTAWVHAVYPARVPRSPDLGTLTSVLDLGLRTSVLDLGYTSVQDLFTLLVPGRLTSK